MASLCADALNSGFMNHTCTAWDPVFRTCSAWSITPVPCARFVWDAEYQKLCRGNGGSQNESHLAVTCPISCGTGCGSAASCPEDYAQVCERDGWERTVCLCRYDFLWVHRWVWLNLLLALALFATYRYGWLRRIQPLLDRKTRYATDVLVRTRPGSAGPSYRHAAPGRNLHEGEEPRPSSANIPITPRSQHVNTPRTERIRARETEDWHAEQQQGFRQPNFGANGAAGRSRGMYTVGPTSGARGRSGAGWEPRREDDNERLLPSDPRYSANKRRFSLESEMSLGASASVLGMNSRPGSRGTDDGLGVGADAGNTFFGRPGDDQTTPPPPVPPTLDANDPLAKFRQPAPQAATPTHDRKGRRHGQLASKISAQWRDRKELKSRPWMHGQYFRDGGKEEWTATHRMQSGATLMHHEMLPMTPRSTGTQGSLL